MGSSTARCLLTRRLYGGISARVRGSVVCGPERCAASIRTRIWHVRSQCLPARSGSAGRAPQGGRPEPCKRGPRMLRWGSAGGPAPRERAPASSQVPRRRARWGVSCRRRPLRFRLPWDEPRWGGCAPRSHALDSHIRHPGRSATSPGPAELGKNSSGARGAHMLQTDSPSTFSRRLEKRLTR